MPDENMYLLPSGHARKNDMRPLSVEYIMCSPLARYLESYTFCLSGRTSP